MKVTQHASGYFHQVSQVLQIMNAVTATKILQEGTSQRKVEVDIGIKLILVNISR